MRPSRRRKGATPATSPGSTSRPTSSTAAKPNRASPTSRTSWTTPTSETTPDGFRIEFEPQGDDEDEAIYRGVLTFPAGLEDDFRPSLRYDEDGFADATVSFVSMQGCVPTPAGSDPGLTALAAEFSGELPAGIYPEMPAGETACSVSVSSVIGGNEIWVIRVDYDPWFRR